jgi:hypothetical protein
MAHPYSLGDIISRTHVISVVAAFSVVIPSVTVYGQHIRHLPGSACFTSQVRYDELEASSETRVLTLRHCGPPMRLPWAGTDWVGVSVLEIRDPSGKLLGNLKEGFRMLRADSPSVVEAVDEFSDTPTNYEINPVYLSVNRSLYDYKKYRTFTPYNENWITESLHCGARRGNIIYPRFFVDWDHLEERDSLKVEPLSVTDKSVDGAIRMTDVGSLAFFMTTGDILKACTDSMALTLPAHQEYRPGLVIRVTGASVQSLRLEATGELSESMAPTDTPPE